MRVSLSPYDPSWADAYVRLAASITTTLGERALFLAHVGSTSIPGLSAKPVIDIALEVADPADEGRYLPALEAAGFQFVLREPDWFDHRLLQHMNPDANLHVFPHQCAETRRMLAFRDHLRADAADRAIYAAAKLALSEQDWRDMDAYAQAKSDVVAEILARAIARRKLTDA